MKTTHLLVLIGINILWGMNFVAAKIGTTEFGPFLFTTLRFAIVLVLLCGFIRWPGKQIWNVVTMSLVQGVAHYSLVFYAIYLTESVSSLAIVTQLVVPFSTILAVLLLKESIGVPRIVAITVAFAGVAIMSFEPLGPQHIHGILITLVGTFCIAYSTIVMRRMQNVGVFNLQAWIALIATPIMGLLTWIIESPTLDTFTEPDLLAYWAPAYAGIAATIIGHGLLYWFIQRYTINSVAPFITLSVVFGVLFSILFLDDVLTLRILIGGLLTLLGVTVVALRNRRL
ncbi:MAG: EamA family transporter [Gammaproteobacteria bacterium]|nr:EamA family transporter [Gammaproteobacteria bacterium]